MRIKLHTIYAGPRGVWSAGAVLVVGEDIPYAHAQELLAGRAAVVVPADGGNDVIETADAAPPETAMVQTSGKKAKGRR